MRQKILYSCLFFIILSGCAGKPGIFSPLRLHYENCFSNFQNDSPSREEIKKAVIKKTYQASYDNVWDSSLVVLAQYAIIIEASKASGLLTYIDIDGIYITDKFVCWEFPFSLYVEKGNNGVITAFVYPMTQIFEKEQMIRDQTWWPTVKTGFDQKGNEFLERLSVQLSGSSQWPWLIK